MSDLVFKPKTEISIPGYDTPIDQLIETSSSKSYLNYSLDELISQKKLNKTSSSKKKEEERDESKNRKQKNNSQKQKVVQLRLSKETIQKILKECNLDNHLRYSFQAVLTPKFKNSH